MTDQIASQSADPVDTHTPGPESSGSQSADESARRADTVDTKAGGRKSSAAQRVDETGQSADAVDATAGTEEGAETADAAGLLQRIREVSAEAKGYRQERADLKAQNEDLQAANEALTARIHRLQAATIRTYLEGRLIDPDDFTRYVPIEEVLDDDGDVDTEVLVGAVDALLETRPHLGHQAPRVPRQSPRPRSRTATVRVDAAGRSSRRSLSDQFGDSGTSWSAVLDRDRPEGKVPPPATARAKLSTERRANPRK